MCGCWGRGGGVLVLLGKCIWGVQWCYSFCDTMAVEGFMAF